jgi:undecaprenyl-diphosphatase
MKKILLLILVVANLLQANIFQDIQDDKTWGKHYFVPQITVYTLAATAVITGNQTRFGKTVYQSIDALIISAIAVEGLKKTFGRVRPRSQELYGGGDTWFESGNNSFPSGHVASMASVVTPFILEYQDDYPMIHLLWALPIHQMFGRYNENAHYKTDVVAGFAVGVLSGWVATKIGVPILLKWTEDGVYTGITLDF